MLRRRFRFGCPIVQYGRRDPLLSAVTNVLLWEKKDDRK